MGCGAPAKNGPAAWTDKQYFRPQGKKMTPLYAEFANGKRLATFIEVLLVESNLENAGETIRAIQQCPEPCRVSLVRDGTEALQFLRRGGIYARTPRPDVILLNPRLAKGDGPQLLAALRTDEQLKSIPLALLAYRQEPGKRPAEPEPLPDGRLAVRSGRNLAAIYTAIRKGVMLCWS